MEDLTNSHVVIRWLNRAGYVTSHWLNRVAGIALIGMMAITIADIVGRKAFNYPLVFAYEGVVSLNVLVVAFAIAFTYVLKGHIQVEFIFLRFPRRVQGIIAPITYLFSFFFFSLLTWQSIKFGDILWQAGEVLGSLRIPLFPFAYAIAFGCVPLCLLLLLDFVWSVCKVLTK